MIKPLLSPGWWLSYDVEELAGGWELAKTEGKKKSPLVKLFEHVATILKNDNENKLNNQIFNSL